MRATFTYLQSVRKREASPALFQKSKKNALVLSVFALNFSFKISFKKIEEKILSLFLLCFSQNVYQNSVVAQNLNCREKCLTAHLPAGIVLLAKCSILNVWQCS